MIESTMESSSAQPADEMSEGEVSDYEPEPSKQPEKPVKGEENKLVKISTSKRHWYGEKYLAAFILEDGTTIPGPNPSVSPFFRIVGMPVDHKVTFFFEVDFDDDKPKYHAQAIIGAESIRKLQLNEKTVDFTTKKADVLVDCIIQADEFVPVSLSQPIDDKDLDKLRVHMFYLPGIRDGIKFRLQVPKETWRSCNLSAQFQGLVRLGTSWTPYRTVRRRTIMSQAGQLLSRQTVQEHWENGTIIKVPAVNYFYDLDEAGVKLVYGAYLEHCVSILHVQRLSGGDHRIVLLPYHQGDFVIGAITFGQLRDDFTPSSLVDQLPMIPDGTSCTVVVVPHDASERRLKLRGVTAPRGIDISVSYDLVVLLSLTGETTGNFVFRSEYKYNCKLDFQVSDENVRAQINAINNLRTEKFSRWHPILLNTDYSILPSVDVFEGIPEDEVKAEYRKVKSMRKWNKTQADVFKLLRQVPGNGFAFIEGIFGCGKTLVQATLAKFIAELGLQVLMVAPTNAALQAISETLSEVAPDLRTVRLVSSAAKGLKKYEVKETDALDTETAMFRLLQNEASSRVARYHVVEKHRLHFHLENLVYTCLAEGKEVPFNYQENPNSEPEEHDAVTEYMRLKDENFSALLRESKHDKAKTELIQKERAIFRKILATLQSTVVSEVQVLLCTNQLAASDLVRQKFGAETNGIVIIADEDGQTLEPTAWLPITLLRHAHKIKAVLRFGDRHQLPPLALSKFSDFNEFGPQINRSLFDRHLRQHPPAVSLSTQYRTIPALSRFPNIQTYEGRLRNGASCSSITLDPLFESRFLEWTKLHVPSDGKLRENIANLVGISVSGAVVNSDPVTCSRSNEKHVRAVKELLMVIFKEQPYPEASIAIIVPYNAQRALYFTVIKDLQVLTKLPYAKLPRVSTVDSMQGHECDIVILDWVCGETDGLGFLKDDRRVNVGLTRARSSLIVLYNDACPEASFDSGEPERKKQARASQVVEHWIQLKQNKRVLDLDYGDDGDCAEAQGGWRAPGGTWNAQEDSSTGQATTGDGW